MNNRFVGILTFHRALNYGAVLQAYALLQEIKKLGYSAEMIDFASEGNMKDRAFFVKPTGKSSLKRDILSLLSLNYLAGRRKCFDSFLEHYMNLPGQSEINGERIKHMLEKYDAVICGSDQIWNAKMPDSDTVFFLPEGDGFIRIAYAASLGKGRLRGIGDPDRIRKALAAFDAVSVREKETKKKIEDFCNMPVPIEITADPTLLHDASFYDEIACERQMEGPYIFVYSVLALKDTFYAARLLSERTGLPYYSLFSGKANRVMFTEKRHIPKGDTGPRGFIAMIRDAEYVVTDSFHGTILSMLFKKKFFIIGEETGGKLRKDERVGYLCDTFKISHRIIRASDISEADLEQEEDWVKIEEIRREKAEKSVQFLSGALSCSYNPEKHSHTDDYRVCPPDLCTGCFACMNICPANALVTERTEDGRIIPKKDTQRCIQCKACSEVCPQNTTPEFNKVLSSYAAQWKEADRIGSASGGISAALSETVLEKGGCVFGAAIGDDLRVHHIFAENRSDAEKIRRSKYVRSDMGAVYRQVQEKLEENREVLFTGTPCQTAGLRNFLGRQYDNLICAEVVCHGTPPMDYLDQHRKIKAPDANWYSFRGGEKDVRMCFKKDSQILYDKPWIRDEYYFAFERGISLSENCYSCPYARPERIGDLTLGDMHIDRSTLNTPMDGRISLVLINTDKGKQVWNEIEGKLSLEERPFEDALTGNPNLLGPTPVSPARRSFLECYEKYGNFETAFNRSYAKRLFDNAGIKSLFLFRALRKVKRLIKCQEQKMH